MIRLSAPSKSGYSRDFDTTQEARVMAAYLLDVAVEDMVEIESPDGGETYCYGSQAELEADLDGAYAVKYFPVSAADLRSVEQ